MARGLLPRPGPEKITPRSSRLRCLLRWSIATSCAFQPPGVALETSAQGLRLGWSILRHLVTKWRNGNVHFHDTATCRKAHPAWFREDIATRAALLSDGRIAPQITGVFPPERASEAHALIREGSAAGRLVLEMRRSSKTLPKPSQ
ncbi:MAG: zinc-binding dehydrogenase [Rhodobacter sp.]|nr:zinc-binding dehydrogenase [Rhodobacter sp.]